MWTCARTRPLWARAGLAKELTARGAAVRFVDVPTGIEGVKGIDDLIGLWGAERVAALFDGTTDVEEEKPHINARIKAEILGKYSFARHAGSETLYVWIRERHVRGRWRAVEDSRNGRELVHGVGCEMVSIYW